MRKNHKPCPSCGGEMHRQSKLCRKCFLKSDEWKRKLSATRKGKPSYERTPEHKHKMSNVLKGKPRPWLKGKKRPDVAAKISAAWTDEMREAARERGRKNAQNREWLLKIARSVSGANNPMWQGGIANSSYAPGFSRSLKAKIRKRDNYTCQLCGTTEEKLGYALSIHHSDYDKKNHDESNLFSLCKPCNSLVNTNRIVWFSYFAALGKTRQLGQDISNIIGRKAITQRKDFICITHNGGPPGLFDAFSRILSEE